MALITDKMIESTKNCPWSLLGEYIYPDNTLTADFTGLNKLFQANKDCKESFYGYAIEMYEVMKIETLSKLSEAGINVADLLYAAPIVIRNINTPYDVESLKKLGVEFSKVPAFDYNGVIYKDYNTLRALKAAGLKLYKFVNLEHTDVSNLLGMHVSRYLERSYLWQGDKQKAKVDFFTTLYFLNDLGIDFDSDSYEISITNFAVLGNLCTIGMNEKLYEHFAPFDLKTDHGCPDFFNSCQPCSIPFKYLAADIQNEVTELFSSYGEIEFEQASFTTLGTNLSNSTTDQLAF